MTKYYNAALALILSSAVAGCEDLVGGGGGGSSDATFAEQAAELEDFQFEIDSFSAVDPGVLPDTGSVSYEGIFSVLADELVLLGDLSMDANFETNEVTGELSNVNGTNGVDYNGSVSLAGGAIDRAAPESQTVTGDLVGEVSEGSNSVVFDTSINGDFLGDNGNFVTDGESYIGGDVTGSVTINGDFNVIAPDDGAFVVNAEDVAD